MSNGGFARAFGALVLAVAAGCGQKEPAPEPKGEPKAEPKGDRGAVVYAQFCAACHGPEGKGDGAVVLATPARAFTARPWRTGPEPTPELVRKATLEGIPAAGMAGFRSPSKDDLAAVVEHVLKLSKSGPPTAKVEKPDAKLFAAAGFANLTGTAAPPLLLTDAKGTETRLSDLTGKLVLLHFWGVGCAVCQKEVPALQKLEQAHAGRLRVLHVCTDEPDVRAAQKVLEAAAPGAVAHVEANDLGLARYQVQALPTVWLVGPDGGAIGSSSGAKDWTAEPQAQLLARWLPPAK
jgi:thiol-disulfide isomerase/thioredoxin